jgi:hypothetical protein
MTTVEATPAVKSPCQAAERAGVLPTRVMGVTGPLRLFNQKRFTSGTVYESPTATVPTFPDLHRLLQLQRDLQRFHTAVIGLNRPHARRRN